MATNKYHVSDHVREAETAETGETGRIVHIYRDPALRHVVAVKFDGRRHALAYHVADLHKIRRRRP